MGSLVKWASDWTSTSLQKIDAALFEQACLGNQKAAHQLVNHLSPKANALAWRLLGDAAEVQDVVQEGFIKIFQTKQFRGDSSLATYFHIVVSRLCLDRLRARKVLRLETNEVLDDVLEDENQNPFQDLQRTQSVTAVQRALMLMSTRQRAILTLWAYQEASISEIAEMMELEINAAHQLLYRAKISLRQKLEGLGYES